MAEDSKNLQPQNGENEIGAAGVNPEGETRKIDSVSVSPPTEETEPSPSHERTILILAVVLAAAATCLCGFMALSSGWTLFGRGNDATPTPSLPIIVTATPGATPTAVPTPEPGEPPQAVISAPNQVVVGVEFELDGSNSVSQEGIRDYVWNFGDGSSGTGATVKHTYVRSGDYVVELTVTARDGLSNTTRVQIRASDPTPTAVPQPPNAIIRAPAQAQAGDSVTFDGSTSTATNAIVSYSWDFGDRTQGSGPVIAHVYSNSGDYQVSLTVTDNTGLNSVANAQISIVDAPTNSPSATIQGPASAVTNANVTFSAEGSQPGSSPIANYAWDFGNGDKQQGARLSTATTTFAAPGQFNVTVVVTDENGQSDTAVQSIRVDASLEGTQWTLSQTLAATTINAEFNRGVISGFTGCNDYSGGYVLGNGNATSGSITISGITMSQKACEADVMSQEGRYLNALQAATSYSISGNTLSLSFAGGTLVYTVTATP